VPRRAVALILPGLAVEKQQAAVLDFADAHHYALISVTGDRHAAISLGQDGLIDLVLSAFDDASTDAVAEAGVELAVVRPHPHRRARESKSAATITRAAEHGLDAGTIAEILGLSVVAVDAVLHPGRPVDRRASVASLGEYRLRRSA